MITLRTYLKEKGYPIDVTVFSDTRFRAEMTDLVMVYKRQPFDVIMTDNGFWCQYTIDGGPEAERITSELIENVIVLEQEDLDQFYMDLGRLWEQAQEARQRDDERRDHEEVKEESSAFWGSVGIIATCVVIAGIMVRGNSPSVVPKGRGK